jgi:hypothetical protein
MDVNAFYQTVATFCFTLLGLWWGVLQLRHVEWVNDVKRKRMAYSVHLAFVVPGVMALGAQTAGDIKIIWRAVFIVAGLLGIIAVVYLILAAGSEAAPPGWFTRYGRWLSALVYAIIVAIAFDPTVVKRLDPALQPLQIEGLLFTFIVFLGVGLAWDFLAQPRQDVA